MEHSKALKRVGLSGITVIVLSIHATSTNAGTLDITCNSRAIYDTDLSISFGGTSYSYSYDYYDNYCNNGDMTEVETAVNDNYTKILANKDRSEYNSQRLGFGHDIASPTGTAFAQINDLQLRMGSSEATIANHETRITANEAAIVALGGQMNMGFAMANAMEVIMPDPGANFRLNVGMGYFGGTTALGVTGVGRIAGDTGLYFGISADQSLGLVSAKGGVSWQW